MPSGEVHAEGPVSSLVRLTPAGNGIPAKPALESVHDHWILTEPLCQILDCEDGVHTHQPFTGCSGYGEATNDPT